MKIPSIVVAWQCSWCYVSLLCKSIALWTSCISNRNIFFQWIPLLTAELQSTYPNITKESSVAVGHNTRYKWEAIRTKWGPQCTKLIVGNLFPRCSSKLPFPIHSPPVTAALSIGSQQYRISEHVWNLTAFKDLISNTLFLNSFPLMLIFLLSPLLPTESTSSGGLKVSSTDAANVTTPTELIWETRACAFGSDEMHWG